MRNYQADIIIAGGGIAGLTLAALLGKAGLQIHIIEPFPSPALKDIRPSGRTVALMNSSLNIVKATGAWPLCEDHSNPMQAMAIHDKSTGNGHEIDVRFYAEDIGLDQFGFNVPNGILRAALFKTVKGISTVTAHTQKLMDYSANEQNVTATLDDGSTLTAPVIIGTDGRGSAVRRIAGIDCHEKDYGQSAITFLINHSRAHDNTSTEFHKPGGPLALVPLPGNTSSVVWVEKTKDADALLALKKDDFIQVLQDKTGSILGGLSLATNPESWPLRSLRAKNLIAPRMALAAEAAHVMSPITAQGLNLSLRDIAALAETIIDAKRLGLDPGSQSILKKYERRRSADIRTRVFGIDTLNQAVANDLQGVKSLRRMGLKTLDAIEPLKNLAMQHGLAPQIDLGRLARGEAL